VPDHNNQDLAIFFGPFRLFPKSRLLEKDGAPLHVGGRALDILIFLAERPGEVVDKRELVKRIWAGVNVDEGSLRFHVAALRKALGDTGKSARYVLNVPGRGYCFVASLTHTAPLVVSSPGDAAPPRSLPPPLAKMIGRDEVIQKISTGLSLYRFITVVGPGGIGKTAVAVTVGHRRLADFGGQVFFIDFGPLRNSNLVAATIASGLGLAAGSEDPVPSLLTYLQARPILLIFDSCVLRNVHGKCGFAHRWPGSDDDQVGTLQAAGHLVQIRIVSSQACNALTALQQGIDRAKRLFDDFLHTHETASDAFLGKLKDRSFSVVKDFFGGISLLTCAHNGSIGCVDQSSQQRLVTNDLDVMLNARPVRNTVN